MAKFVSATYWVMVLIYGGHRFEDFDGVLVEHVHSETSQILQHARTCRFA